MLLTATVQVAATVDNPLSVALTAIGLLRAQVLADERSSLKLSVLARDNSRFMTHLKSFVSAHPGAHQNIVKGFFEVILTDGISFDDAVSFVATLLADWPDALASATLSLVAEGIRWRGAPDSAVGSLRLIDGKAFARGTPEQRSTLSASLTCRGASLEEPAFLADLKAAADETKVAFPEGKLSALRDPNEVAPPDQRLAVEVGFHEALVRTRDDIRSQGIDWRGRPGLTTYDQAVEFRFEHWGEGTRVSLPGPIKRFMKSGFPDFTPKKGRGLWFLKPITEELALHLVFDNDHLGSIGKGFTVLVGLEGISGSLDGVAWRESLFRIFSADRLQPCWIYSTKDDLATALSGLDGLLRTVLAPLESHCRQFLEPLPEVSTLSGEIERRGPITARDAWPEAIAEARAWSSKAALFRLTSGGEPDTCARLGPGLAPDGRLRPHSHWSYLFRSSERPSETFVVEVPPLGAVRSSLSSPHPTTHLAIGEEWLDTDRLLAICKNIWRDGAAEQSLENAFALRCELRTGRSPIGIEERGTAIRSATTEPPPSDRWWTVECTTRDLGRVRKSTARLDAVSGGHVRVVVETY